MHMSKEENHEQAMVFSIRKKLVTYWLGMAGYVANALFRTLGLNSFDDDTSSSSCPWTQNLAKTRRRLSYPSAFPSADKDTDEGRSEQHRASGICCRSYSVARMSSGVKQPKTINDTEPRLEKEI